MHYAPTLHTQFNPKVLIRLYIMLTCLSVGILNLPVFVWGPSTFVLTLITFLITFTALCSPLTGTIALQQPRVVLERWRVRFTLWKNSPHVLLKLAIAVMHRVERRREGDFYVSNHFRISCELSYLQKWESEAVLCCLFTSLCYL